MKKIIALALFGIGLFGLSAGVGMALKPKPVPAEGTAEHGDADSTEGAATAGADHGEASAEAHGTESSATAAKGAGNSRKNSHAGTKPAGEHGDSAETGHDEHQEESIPTAIRPDSMSVEEIVRYGMGLKERDEAVRVREAGIERREEQQQMILSDILSEQKELEGLHAQARDQRLAVEQLLKDIAAQKSQLDADRKKLEDDRKNLDLEKARLEGSTSTGKRTNPITLTAADRTVNAKLAASTISGMPPQEAAQTLETYYNESQDGPADAVEILLQVDEKKRSPILAAVSDTTMRVDILRRMMNKPRVQKSSNRR
jgi:flagellar motility protein MotE (MotC chaperone)